jgi:hypothetical protein
MKTQHPLVRRFAANAQRKGVGIYAGKSFAVARFPKGWIELRVDKQGERDGDIAKRFHPA